MNMKSFYPLTEEGTAVPGRFTLTAIESAITCLEYKIKEAEGFLRRQSYLKSEWCDRCKSYSDSLPGVKAELESLEALRENPDSCYFKCRVQQSRYNGSQIRFEPLLNESPRCAMKTPSQWGDTDPNAERWLGSGGSPFVLGFCSEWDCPKALKAMETIA